MSLETEIKGLQYGMALLKDKIKAIEERISKLEQHHESPPIQDERPFTDAFRNSAFNTDEPEEQGEKE